MIVRKAAEKPIATDQHDKPTPAATGELPFVREMSVADWIVVPNNRHQRDTDRHLIRAKHLRTRSPAHVAVTAAELPDGSLIKLDGHTRARFWQLNPNAAPDKVLVSVYRVASIDEADLLYHHFDNRVAVDTSSDDLSGAFRAAGFEPTSELFKSYRGTWALKRATILMLENRVTNGIDIYRVVPLWLPQLRAIDNLAATPQRFNNPIIAAALLTIRRRGQPAIDFMSRYQQDAGLKTATTVDGVEALSRMAREISFHGEAAGLTILGRSISCIEKFLSGEVFLLGRGAGPRMINPLRYCAGIKRDVAPFLELLAEEQSRDKERQKISNEVRRYVLRDPNYLNRAALARSS